VDFTLGDGSIVVGITTFEEISVVFVINIIFWVDSVITIGIIVSNNFSHDNIDFITVPSTFTGNTDIWSFTISHRVTSTVFSSVGIFTSNNTFEDFTFVELLILVLVTIFIEPIKMVIIKIFITIVELFIIVTIIVREEVFSDIEDIITSPFIWAINDIKWAITIDIWIVNWTIGSSPFIFDHNDTVV